MKYKVGDRVQLRTWEDLISDNKVTYYNLVKTEAVGLPDGHDFTKEQYDKLCEISKDMFKREMNY